LREQRIDFAYESAMLPVALAALATCAPVAPAPEPVTGSPESVQPGFDPAALQADPEATARLRFGKALVSRALAAPVHLFAKHYMGLAPPPIVQPDGSYRYPDPPMAMLIREDGQWKADLDDWDDSMVADLLARAEPLAKAMEQTVPELLDQKYKTLDEVERVFLERSKAAGMRDPLERDG